MFCEYSPRSHFMTNICGNPLFRTLFLPAAVQFCFIPKDLFFLNCGLNRGTTRMKCQSVSNMNKQTETNKRKDAELSRAQRNNLLFL